MRSGAPLQARFQPSQAAFPATDAGFQPPKADFQPATADLRVPEAGSRTVAPASHNPKRPSTGLASCDHREQQQWQAGTLRCAAPEAGVHLADEPVPAEGRIEVLSDVREESLSPACHRYGKLGGRGSERRAEPG